VDLAPFVERAIACVHRPYPTIVGRMLHGDGDLVLPRLETPAFSGCLDWHSAVHNHWLLARAARMHPAAPFAAPAREALGRSLSAENLDAELRFVRGRAGFELPYGMAWLLTLCAELRGWDDPDARAWAARAAPLEAIAAERITAWLEKLRHPVRSGTHEQSAFSAGLALDWARGVGDAAIASRLAARAVALFGSDRDGALHLEPSGTDFLSPCLAEADLMRRVLSPTDFATFLDRFLPGLEPPAPARVPDPEDFKLVHLDGLNLSRAWMLRGIAAGLPVDDRSSPRGIRRSDLLAASAAHAEAGLPAARTDHYGGAHWLPTFAVYLVTEMGLRSPA
jgi:hypothetical protein